MFIGLLACSFFCCANIITPTVRIDIFDRLVSIERRVACHSILFYNLSTVSRFLEIPSGCLLPVALCPASVQSNPSRYSLGGFFHSVASRTISTVLANMKRNVGAATCEHDPSEWVVAARSSSCSPSALAQPGLPAGTCGHNAPPLGRNGLLRSLLLRSISYW